jgi:ATPase subunit of ABC transporter with duplicated ATPase domains
MAGIDTDFTGEAWAGENITVGYLAQEPQLDPSKTVLENVKDGARETADMVGKKWARCRKRSTRSTAGRSTTSLKSRWKRCAARRATGRVDNLSGGEKRRIALCGC